MAPHWMVDSWMKYNHQSSYGKIRVLSLPENDTNSCLFLKGEGRARKMKYRWQRSRQVTNRWCPDSIRTASTGSEKCLLLCLSENMNTSTTKNPLAINLLWPKYHSSITANTKSKTFLEKLSSCFCDPRCRLCRALTQLLRLTAGEDRRAAKGPWRPPFLPCLPFSVYAVSVQQSRGSPSCN